MNKPTLAVLAISRSLTWCLIFAGCFLIVWAAAMLIIALGNAFWESALNGGTFHVKVASYAAGVLVAVGLLAFGAATRAEYRRLAARQEETQP
jgi:hypothetical protein